MEKGYLKEQSISYKRSRRNIPPAIQSNVQKVITSFTLTITCNLPCILTEINFLWLLIESKSLTVC